MNEAKDAELAEPSSSIDGMKLVVDESNYY